MKVCIRQWLSLKSRCCVYQKDVVNTNRNFSIHNLNMRNLIKLLSYIDIFNLVNSEYLTRFPNLTWIFAMANRLHSAAVISVKHFWYLHDFIQKFSELSYNNMK